MVHVCVEVGRGIRASVARTGDVLLRKFEVSCHHAVLTQLLWQLLLRQSRRSDSELDTRLNAPLGRLIACTASPRDGKSG